MKLTYQQRAALASIGIVVVIEFGDGMAKCRTVAGDDMRKISDLAKLANKEIHSRIGI